MKSLGISPREFATRLGLKSVVQISQYTNDRRVPERDRIIEMADILGVSTDWLLTGNGKGPSVGMVGRGGIPEALWPQVVNFERDMARLGATNRDLDYLGAVLRLPHTAELLTVDDDADQLSVFGQNEQLSILLRALEWWTRARVASRLKPDESEPQRRVAESAEPYALPVPRRSAKRASDSE